MCFLSNGMLFSLPMGVAAALCTSRFQFGDKHDERAARLLRRADEENRCSCSIWGKKKLSAAMAQRANGANESQRKGRLHFDCSEKLMSWWAKATEVRPPPPCPLPLLHRNTDVTANARVWMRLRGIFRWTKGATGPVCSPPHPGIVRGWQPWHVGRAGGHFMSTWHEKVVLLF